MAHDDERVSSAGSFVGILSAILFVAVLFGGYWMLSNGPQAQSNAANTQQAPAVTPSPDSTKITPPPSQEAPKADAPRDAESTSQNAN